MKGYLQILMQPVLQRCAAGPLWMTWLLTAFMLVGVVVAEVVTGKTAIVGVALFIPLGSLTILWWIAFIQSAVQQNLPLHAQLVPQHRGRLMRLTAMLWLAGTLALGCLSALALGHFCMGLLASAALLFVMAVGQRYPKAGAVPALLVMVFNLLPHPVIHPWLLVERYGESAVAIAGLILLAGAGAALLPLMYLRGGDRHWRWQMKFAYRQEVLRTGVMPESGASLTTKWGWWQQIAYTMSLKRACSGGVSSARMQMYALGPNAYWMRYTVMPALLTLVSAALSILLGPSVFLNKFAPLYSVFLTMIGIGMFVQNVGVAIYRTSTEQGLLRLTPGAVPEVIFNRSLARALLGGFFKLWLVSAVSVVVIGKIFGGAGWIYLLSLTALLLPFSVLLLRNFAAMREPYGSSMTALMAAGALLVLLASSAVDVLLWSQVWMATGIACVLLTALLLGRGWRRMMAMPAAFPASRMA